MNLSKKLSYYLSLAKEAKAQQLPVRQVAENHGIRPGTLYGAMNRLRAMGALSDEPVPASGFAKVDVPTARSTQDDTIELKTQLTNGQPVWMAVPVQHIQQVLQSLAI